MVQLLSLLLHYFQEFQFRSYGRIWIKYVPNHTSKSSQWFSSKWNLMFIIIKFIWFAYSILLLTISYGTVERDRQRKSSVMNHKNLPVDFAHLRIEKIVLVHCAHKWPKNMCLILLNDCAKCWMSLEWETIFEIASLIIIDICSCVKKDVMARWYVKLNVETLLSIQHHSSHSNGTPNHSIEHKPWTHSVCSLIFGCSYEFEWMAWWLELLSNSP